MSVHQTFPRAPDKRLLTGDEAAAYCGVTLPTLRSHVKVAPMKIGGAVRYDRVALDRWIDGRTNAAPMTGDDWLDKLDED